MATLEISLCSLFLFLIKKKRVNGINIKLVFSKLTMDRACYCSLQYILLPRVIFIIGLIHGVEE